MNRIRELPTELVIAAALLIAPGLIGIVWELVTVVYAMVQPVFSADPTEMPLSTLYFVLFASIPLNAVPVGLGLGLLFLNEVCRWLSILYMAAWSLWKLSSTGLVFIANAQEHSTTDDLFVWAVHSASLVLACAYLWAICALSRLTVRIWFKRDDHPLPNGMSKP